MIQFSEPPTVIEGVTPSQQIREELAASGRPVLLAFSRGKDSIAAWLAMREAGINVVPYHMHRLPDPDQPAKGLRGLAFIEENLSYFEDWFGTRILRVIHPAWYRQISNFVFQPPGRIAPIDALQLPVPTYEELVAIVREELGLPPDTYACDGVRAADSPQRRVAMASHGPINYNQHKIHIVWDWRKKHIREAIAQSGIKLPVDYELWNRSFDGIDYRFLPGLRDRFPEDWQRLLFWFPMVDLFIFRHDMMAAREEHQR